MAQPRGPAWGNKASKPLAVKPVGVEAAGEAPSLTREVIGETPGVLECTQTHLRNQHQKGPVCLWVAGKVTESLWRAEQPALFPL